MARLRALPLFVFILFINGLAMLVPAAFAWSQGDWDGARVFGFSAVFVLLIVMCIGLAVINRRPRVFARAHLVTIMGAYLAVPAISAIPLVELTQTLELNKLYFEMLSCLTTTGATVFQSPDEISPAIHLWRGLVAWLGGFFAVFAAIALLEPLNLGGFEVQLAAYGAKPGVGATRVSSGEKSFNLTKHLRIITPIYVVATASLAVLLIIAGDAPFVGVMHAMAVISTSGISPVGSLEMAASGIPGEVAIILFFGFALSYRVFVDTGTRSPASGLADPELKTALIIVLVVSLFLFLRHFSGAFEILEADNPATALAAFWGALFTSVSFLTTTGFESQMWDSARNWSGLDTPNLILLILAVIGGGTATTAGGIKLMRAVALLSHGNRELKRLVHPSSVGGYGNAARRIRTEGAYIAWMFVMLFFLSAGLGLLGFSLAGYDFESAFIISVASLANVGPLVAVLEDGPTVMRTMDFEPQLIVNALMLIGRMEVLAVVALMNPEYWQR